MSRPGSICYCLTESFAVSTQAEVEVELLQLFQAQTKEVDAMRCANYARSFVSDLQKHNTRVKSITSRQTIQKTIADLGRLHLSRVSEGIRHFQRTVDGTISRQVRTH